MSSILDSLKKLEKETSQQDHPLTHARVGTRAFIPKYVIGIIGFLCLCLVAIGLAAYYRGVPKKMPESTAKALVPAPESAVVVNQPKTPGIPRQSPPAPLPSSTASDQATTATAALKPEPVEDDSIAILVPEEEQGSIPGVNPEAKQVAAIQETPREEKALIEPKPQASTAEKETSDSLSALSEKAPGQENLPASIDRLEGVSIKIQAISWSDIPENSLAVINNQVLRVGDGIEGYQISRINPDDIILQRGGKAFRLDFRSTGAP